MQLPLIGLDMLPPVLDGIDIYSPASSDSGAQLRAHRQLREVIFFSSRGIV